MSLRAPRSRRENADIQIAPTAPSPTSRYLNRELGWLAFNRRVLAEALNPANPPLERCRFLAIFESNLDEFFMVRVSGLIEQLQGGVVETSPDGLGPAEQLAAIADALRPIRREAGEAWTRDLAPLLATHGVEVVPWRELPGHRQADLRRWFEREVFPVCTPLVLDPAPSMPFISSRSLNLAVLIDEGPAGGKLARVKIPSILPRAVPVGSNGHTFVLLEDLVAQHLSYLFPDVPLTGAYRFRVVRDADIEIRELEAGDLIDVIQETIRQRRFGDPVRLDVGAEMPDEVVARLTRLLDVEPRDVYRVDGLLGFDVLQELADLPDPALRWTPHKPFVADALTRRDELFQTIAAGDVLLHHPFDGFQSVETFVSAAASDPAVIGIKQTLYRVGEHSPIVEALLEAAEAGKQVAVMVELKARFDESKNLVWARALERAGAHVTYGFTDLKVHAKLCLVVRREVGGLRTYAHIGTGNYNPSTARLYTDLGLLTCDPDITQDMLELFNFLTGVSRQRTYRKLLVAPLNLRRELLHRLRRERDHARAGRPSGIILKLNSLTDPELIDALYDVAAAGARIELIVRGICCLRPRVAGLSETVRVVSVVGRFLEHSRIFWFENGGAPEALLGSADIMRRNLDRRIETLVPVTQPALVRHLHDGILRPYLDDTTNAWELQPDGTYQRRETPPGQPAFCAQEYLMAHASTATLSEVAGRGTSGPVVPSARFR